MRNHRRGAAAIEFALTLPVFVLMLGGALEWGWVMPHELDAEHVARDAARAGALAAPGQDPIALATTRATQALAEQGVDPGRATVAVSLGNAVSGTTIQVQVTVPYDTLLGLVPAPVDLHGDATMHVEHP